MRLVTLNTWKNEGLYARRLELMGRGLAALSADVICLQECFAAEGVDTAAHLGRMTGLAVYARPARSKTRRHGEGTLDSTSGLAVLSRQPGPERACELESDPADGQRIAQRFDLVGEAAPLRVLNLHLTHLRGPAAASLRGRQLNQALDWARLDWTGAIVALGDFNAALDEPAFAPALRGASAPDRPEADHPRRATLHGAGLGQAPAMVRPIDHALLFDPDGAWRVRRRFLALDRPDTEGWFPSDHAAVVVDLEPAFGGEGR